MRRKTDDVPVYQLTYRFVLHVYRLKVKLPKLMKYDLGEATTKASLRLLHSIVMANESTDKVKPLKMAVLEVESLWVFSRLLFDLKAISQGEFKVLSESLYDIEKQLYNWGAWAKKKTSQEKSEKL